MKVSFENPDKINGLLTITVEDDDYKAEVEKTLKEYRKTANVPGFRPGQVPMGMIRRRFGSAVKMDAINKVLGDELQKYIADNNIAMLGEPLASEKQQPQDLEKDGPYTFMFDIAVAPEFDIKLDANDTVDYYEIAADDTLIDSQVEMFASRMGQNVEADHYEDGEILGLQLAELGLEQRILSVHELNGVLEVLLKLLAQQLIALLGALCAHLGALELCLVVDRLQPVVLDG